MDVMNCQSLAVPYDVMHHVASIESSLNPYAIGVVGAHLVRQPRSLGEAVATARMLETRGYNFSVGLAQVNRHNLPKYGLRSYQDAFDGCTSLRVGARILSECFNRSGHDWGRAFSCYYSGNFVTGFRTGYVQKVVSLWRQGAGAPDGAISLTRAAQRSTSRVETSAQASSADVGGPVSTPAASDTAAQMTSVGDVRAARSDISVDTISTMVAPGPDAAFVF